ncbi:hypothetical protein HYDPIDRAFT_44542 [Hydnomerulius pinastri MD-312]|uniref:Uncharacterized protein n=1 Tax=Hydnomerulius pinastri MD-312 TaxID=994086 RepID=A0A0C9W6C9_9AGAM|nr:hypothetical protein HYDPIDRAFT_44542 [Hydnomerulius pinastri MD-312]
MSIAYMVKGNGLFLGSWKRSESCREPDFVAWAGKPSPYFRAFASSPAISEVGCLYTIIPVSDRSYMHTIDGLQLKVLAVLLTVNPDRFDRNITLLLDLTLRERPRAGSIALMDHHTTVKTSHWSS